MIIIPRSDKSRLAFLRASLAAATGDYEKGNKYIFRDTFDKLNEFFPRFESHSLALNKAKSGRSAKVREFREKIRELELVVQDGMETVRRQIPRNNLPKSKFNIYGMEQDGKTPRPKDKSQWLVIGRSFLNGAESEAAEQSHYSSFLPPHIHIIKQKLEEAEKSSEEAKAADRNYDIEQEKRAMLREKANDLIQYILAELRYSLLKLDKPSQRRIKRSYGVVFDSKEEEIEKEKEKDEEGEGKDEEGEGGE